MTPDTPKVKNQDLTPILDKVTYHAVYDESTMEALRYARGNGFAGVQVAVEAPHLAFEDLSGAECDEIAGFCAGEGMRVSVHAPDYACSLFEVNRHLREGIFRYFRALLDFAERIGSELITLHLGTMATFGTDTVPRRTLPEVDAMLYRRALRENLARLIDLADGRVLLCVENVGLDEPAMEALQEHLDSGRLHLCWDLAKTYTGSQRCNEELEEYYWRNISHIRQIHIHDVGGGPSYSHYVIGTGRVDFMHFLPRLAKGNVEEYCIEVRPREKAVESLASLRGIIARRASP